MADTIDMAVEIQAEHVARGLARARVPIAAGVPGECDNCGEDMPRLVNGLCGFCRDGRIPLIRRAPTEIVPPEEAEAVMPAKSIQLPASAVVAIEAVEERARTLRATLGEAAADLIVAGAQTITAENSPPPKAGVGEATLDALLDEIRMRCGQNPIGREIAALTARAEAAEAKLAQIQAALA